MWASVSQRARLMSPTPPHCLFFEPFTSLKLDFSPRASVGPSMRSKAGDADTPPPTSGPNVGATTRRSGQRDNRNPLAFLGLKRVGPEGEADQDPAMASPKEGGIELNRRGIPARKRKKNSLIYGQDDLVSIPIKSPKKRANNGKTASNHSTAVAEKKVAVAVASVKTPVSTPTRQSRSTPPSPVRAIKPSASTSKTTTARRTPSKRQSRSTPASPVKRAIKLESADDFELTSPEKKSAHGLSVALRNLLKLPKAHKWVCYEFFYSNIDRVLFEGENDFMVCLRESFPQLKSRRLTRVEWCKIRRLMGKPRRCSAAFFAEERTELAKKRQKIRLLQQRKQGEIYNFKDLPDQIPLQLTIGARVTARLRKPQDGLFTGSVDGYDTSNNTYRITFDRNGLGAHSIPDHEVLSTEQMETLPLSNFSQRPKPRPIPQPVVSYPSPMKYTPNFSPQLANDPLLSGSTPKGKVMHLDGRLGGYPVKFLDLIVRLSKCLKKKRELVTSLRDLNTHGERLKSFGEYISEDFQRRYAGNEGCQEDAYDMVNKNNTSDDKEFVENPKTLALISSLTALMLQIKHLADGERSAYELQSLQDSLSEIKLNLHPENSKKFDDSVMVHLHHIQSGVAQIGNLHAFMQGPAALAKSEPL
eukprot:TCALIF_00053-PA protein Name:"Similar to LIN9 Protein lin-9 homolog (Homo sapiens)" AED:0.07 eAED:0.07 QI:75/0.2/0.16/1/1/1/6/0/643